VLLLQNMVTLPDLTDDDAFEDLLDDMEDECEKFGVVRSVAIPRPLAPLGAPPAPASSRGPRVPLGQGTGRIFVEFDSADAAAAAQQKMNGRIFNGNKVVASFWPEEKFAAKQWV
jgi:splicing factor U2AF subunit